MVDYSLSIFQATAHIESALAILRDIPDYSDHEYQVTFGVRDALGALNLVHTRLLSAFQANHHLECSRSGNKNGDDEGEMRIL